MESAGTVLTTNWGDVANKKVEVKPPDDAEYKKFWASPISPWLPLPHLSSSSFLTSVHLSYSGIRRRRPAAYMAGHCFASLRVCH